MPDESDRAKRMRQLELLKRRWPPGDLEAAADRERRLRDFERLHERGRRPAPRHSIWRAAS